MILNSNVQNQVWHKSIWSLIWFFFILLDCEIQRKYWLKFSKNTKNSLGPFTGNDPINNSMLCGLDSFRNVSSHNCQHISGQPLIYKSDSDGRWFLHGVVSGTWFSNVNDCHLSLPTVYVSVTYYTEWIFFNSIEGCLNTDN